MSDEDVKCHVPIEESHNCKKRMSNGKCWEKLIESYYRE